MDLTNLIYVVGLFINFEIKLLFYIFLNRFIYFYSISNDTTNQPVQHRLRWLRIRQKLNLKVESIKINWLGFILSQTQTFVGLFFTIYVYNPQKVMEKKATFSQLVMWFTPRYTIPIQKVTACSRHPTKGFTWWGVPSVAVSFPFQGALKAINFLFCSRN